MISVALKTPLQIRLGIGIHKTSLLRFHTQLPPTFYNKIAPTIGYSDCDLDQPSFTVKIEQSDVGISTA